MELISQPNFSLYSHILSNPSEIKSVPEIAIETRNSDVVSILGADCVPGASLKALRDFCPHGQIYGGNIDSIALFTDNRKATFQIDQTNYHVFKSRVIDLNTSFDLIVDDVWHSFADNV